MEGLKGTAIRLAVRDPGCPQAPVLTRARRLPALIRGSSCGWLRPRPPIPARPAHSQHPARRVARRRGKSTVAAGTRIFDERSSPGDVSGSPGADRTSPVLPALVKASHARIAIGINRETDPAASNEGSSPENQQRWPGTSGPTILSEGSSPRATSSGDQLMCPLGLPGRHAREDPVPGQEQAGIAERSQPRPRETPLTRRKSERPAQDLAHPSQAPLLSLARRTTRQGHPRIADPRSINKMERVQSAERHVVPASLNT